MLLYQISKGPGFYSWALHRCTSTSWWSDWITKWVRVGMWDLNFKCNQWGNSGRRDHHWVKLWALEAQWQLMSEGQAMASWLRLRAHACIFLLPSSLMAITVLHSVLHPQRPFIQAPNLPCSFLTQNLPLWMPLLTPYLQDISGTPSRCFHSISPLWLYHNCRWMVNL